MQIKINITFIKWDFHIYTIGEPHLISYFYENLKCTLDFHKNTTSKSTKKTGPCNPAL